MLVIDSEKLRDYFYWGINDKPVISPEIDKLMINIIDECSVNIDIKNSGIKED